MTREQLKKLISAQLRGATSALAVICDMYETHGHVEGAFGALDGLEEMIAQLKKNVADLRDGKHEEA